jgi:predicted amidohydrolase
MVKIAISQSPSALSKTQALETIFSDMNKAASEGAGILAYGECWWGGYPAWIDFARDIAVWDHPVMKKEWARIYGEAMVMGSEEHRELEEACKRYGMALVLGCNEVQDTGVGNNTIYNSILFISGEGKTVHHHRKLVPTFNEKLIYGQGDGRGLTTVDLGFARVGGLVCWEHWMPLSRFALREAGEDVHFALWPDMKDRHLLASRHYAFEGRCVVVAVGQIMGKEAIPDGLEVGGQTDKLILKGGSCVIGPDGELMKEPQYGTTDLIIVDLPDREALLAERMTLSVAGHYHRPDVFDFRVKREK